MANGANLEEQNRQLRSLAKLIQQQVRWPGHNHLWYAVSVIHFVETKERMLAVRLPFPSDVPITTLLLFERLSGSLR